MTETHQLSELLRLMEKTKRLLGKEFKATTETPQALPSLLQAETLDFIKNQKPPTMKEIAHHLHVTAPSATTMIDSLVKANMIQRILDPQDRRLVRLQVTEEGESFLTIHYKKLSEKLEKLINILSAEELKTLVNIHKKITEHYK